MIISNQESIINIEVPAPTESLSERGGIIMNTFWLKIAGVAVFVVGVIFLISVFSPGNNSEPKEPQKTVYDQWEEDEKKLSAEPQYKEPPAISPSV